MFSLQISVLHLGAPSSTTASSTAHVHLLQHSVAFFTVFALLPILLDLLHSFFFSFSKSSGCMVLVNVYCQILRSTSRWDSANFQAFVPLSVSDVRHGNAQVRRTLNFVFDPSREQALGFCWVAREGESLAFLSPEPGYRLFFGLRWCLFLRNF